MPIWLVNNMPRDEEHLFGLIPLRVLFDDVGRI